MINDCSRRKFIKMLGIGTAAVFLPGCNLRAENLVKPSEKNQKSSKSKPNIIFILADDLGYGDVSCLNPKCKIKTVNIDKLAAEGKTFVDSHTSSAVCTPTRYSILTGRYNWRSRLKKNVLFGYSKPLIEKDRPTVASYLKENGYTTACMGKWHLGLLWGVKDGHSRPEEKSDSYEGTDYRGSDSSWIDFSKPFEDGPLTKGFDYFFGISASLDMPPYVYLEGDKAMALPTEMNKSWNRHGVMAKGFDATNVLGDLTRKATEWIEQNKNKPFFLYLPLNAPHKPHRPSAEFQGKSGVSTYYDFCLEVDWSIGQIMDALDRSGTADNTVLIFTSDNGPEDKSENGGESGTAYPLRGRKRDSWDGGHRTPYFVRWPGKIEAGSKSSQIICTTDFFATCSNIIGKPVVPPDSMNILPAYLGTDKGLPIREATVHHSSQGKFAIRKGKWKLITHKGSGGNRYKTGPNMIKPNQPPMQLYDMSVDISEQKNLYESEPAKVKELLELLEKYKSEGHSQPDGAPDFM